MSDTEKKIIKLYTGENLTFYPVSHWYKLEGQKTYLLSPSSITGILDKSEALLIWNAGLMRNYFIQNLSPEEQYSKENILVHLEKAIDQRKVRLEEAKDIGTIVHEYAELFAYHQVMGIEKPEIPFYADEKAINGINAFLDLVVKHNIKFKEVERFIYSQKGNFAGRFDAIVEIDGIDTLVDFKTSKGIYSSQKYQLAGYHIAMLEEFEYKKQVLPYKNLAMLHFSKETGIAEIVKIEEEEIELCISAFNGLLATKKVEKLLNKWSK